jgi:hypothetical protein
VGKLGLKLRVVICFEKMLVLRLQFFGGTKGLNQGSNFFEMSKKLVLRLGFL